MNSKHPIARVGTFVAPAFVLLSICLHSVAATAESMDPFDIAKVLSRFTIPRVALRNVTIGEALKFYAMKYHDVDGDPRPADFDFEIRLPNDVLQHRVSVKAEDITLLEVLQRTLKGVPVSITLEPGKVVLSSPPLFPDAKASPTKP
jgi:hypothetical protein